VLLCTDATGSPEYSSAFSPGMPFWRFLLPVPRFPMESKDPFFGEHFWTNSTSLLLPKTAI
jgi:hypothetical protein